MKIIAQKELDSKWSTNTRANKIHYSCGFAEKGANPFISGNNYELWRVLDMSVSFLEVDIYALGPMALDLIWLFKINHQ